MKEMNEDKFCERLKGCPIYAGYLKSNDVLSSAYKHKYCETENGKEICKRYQVAKIMGYCPEYILPNSQLPVEEIIKDEEKRKQSSFN
ncbi:MAG: hypothetical protein LBQ60_19450 [Bacteroidales bacterium]|jgi:hypothetical protein|nr:hypothetical protein [Bacteroidales bacterium]